MISRIDSRRSNRLHLGLGLISASAFAVIGYAAGRAGAEPEDIDEATWRTESRSAPMSGVAETGRGRSAETPSAIPAKGWIDILWRTYQEFMEDRLMLVAAGVTFYVLLALFPAVTAMISIYGLFTDASNIGDQMRAMSGILPSGAVDILGEQMARVASHSDGKLGFGMVFGLGVALWSANAGMKTLFDALNIVYEETEKRSFLKLTLVTLCFTLGMIVFLILALSSVVLLPIVLDFIGLGGIEPWLLFLRWPVLLVIVALGLSAVYRIGPSREYAKWRWLTWGAGIAAVLWVGFSLAFSWYVQNFGAYDETYGSLGAAIGFMTWIWISTIVVLIGGELNAEVEHQTARDTTIRPARPIGARGAQMADTIGQSRGGPAA